MADVDDLQLHLTPLQDIIANALLWLMIVFVGALTVQQYVAMEHAEYEALRAAERVNTTPLVVYEKPYTVNILGRRFRIERELAVPERSGR